MQYDARILADALRRAAAAHHEYEKQTGVRDESWPEWYANYIVAERDADDAVLDALKMPR